MLFISLQNLRKKLKALCKYLVIIQPLAGNNRCVTRSFVGGKLSFLTVICGIIEDSSEVIFIKMQSVIRPIIFLAS